MGIWGGLEEDEFDEEAAEDEVDEFEVVGAGALDDGVFAMGMVFVLLHVL